MWIAALVAALAGCPADSPPECVTVDTACSPLYQPTFANVFQNTLRTGCGSTNGSCHSSTGDSGMSLADPAAAHASLLAGRVKAGDPGCSEMIVRTHSPGKSYEMPPDAPLSAAERCALVQWIQSGAPP